MKLTSREQLAAVRLECRQLLDAQNKKILVCGGSGCTASGSAKIYDELCSIMAERGLNVQVSLDGHVDHGELVGIKNCGCHGICELAPLIRIEPEGILYTRVKLEDCADIIDKTIIGGEVIDKLIYHVDGASYAKQEDIPFYKKQTRIVLNNCGHIDSESIEEYLAIGGYSAVEKALFDMTPDEIINEVTASGLRGRGGAGFPAGKKWSQVAAHKDEPVKYIVCNGDEGDPGAFMDCSVMEGDPHKMIEGMIIAGIACGAEQGVIYVRAEYPLAVKRLGLAIEKATEYGLLGDDILGSGKSFHLRIAKGAGAFVCGEGSAMQASIEGKRGMPRTKPPRSVDKGLFDVPTSLNNVETFANVPEIIMKGAEWYSSIGSEGNSGTKVFSLAGNIKNTGLIEVPMGTTLREIVFDIGGGVKDGNFKAVQVGGPAGCCLTTGQLDTPLDFDSTKKIGAIIGSGGLVVMGDDTCMVEIARFFTDFSKKESCGKCTACRDGIPRILAILEKITNGEGTLEDLDMLEELSAFVRTCSLCGLGKNATNPVSSTLKYFRDEYLAHIVDRKCPAGQCKGLKHYVVDPEICLGCGKCKMNCPGDAITGAVRVPHVIDIDKCVRCGLCAKLCPVRAIKEE